MTIPIAQGLVICGYKWKGKGENGKLEIESQFHTMIPHTSNEVDAWGGGGGGGAGRGRPPAPPPPPPPPYVPKVAAQ